VNGYVEQDGELSMWVARRSKQKPTWPGLLDHMAAGGQVGILMLNNGRVVRQFHSQTIRQSGFQSVARGNFCFTEIRYLPAWELC
jgi:hypothetical protein